MYNVLTTASRGKAKPFPLLGAALGLIAAALPTATHAQSQIALTQSSVVGGTYAYGASTFNSGQFSASYIFDDQSQVTIDESDQTAGDANGSFWLGNQSVSAQNVVIDLGSQYNLSTVQIYNTHNGPYNDRGTQNFQIYGSNSVVAGATTGNGVNLATATLLITGTLAYQTDDGNPATGELTAQTFTFSGGTSYRYLRINTLSGYPNGGSQGVGLNEVKVFGSLSAPEPSSLALLVPAALSLVGAARGRRRRASATA